MHDGPHSTHLTRPTAPHSACFLLQKLVTASSACFTLTYKNDKTHTIVSCYIDANLTLHVILDNRYPFHSRKIISVLEHTGML